MGVGCAPPFPLHSPVLHLFVHIVSDQTEVGEELSLGDVVRVDGVVRVVLWGRMYGSGFDGVVGNRRDRNRSGTRHSAKLPIRTTQQQKINNNTCSAFGLC
jgi:hypothetical protein